MAFIRNETTWPGAKNTHTCRVLLGRGPGLTHAKTGVWYLSHDLSTWP